MYLFNILIAVWSSVALKFTAFPDKVSLVTSFLLLEFHKKIHHKFDLNASNQRSNTDAKIQILAHSRY